jgi:peptide/nickel transport system ATP-binding protein
MSAAPLLEVIGLSKSFRARRAFGQSASEVKAVRDVSFKIAPGEVFGLAGESGSGKSTIARMILGLTAPSAGAIIIGGGEKEAERRRGKSVQMVFQNPGSSLNPRRSVGQSIAVPLEAAGARRAAVAARVEDLLKMVQLPADFAERYPHELSGGQKQRVAIARALAAEPRLILLDEPTSALDVSVQAKIIELLQELGRTLGLTFLFISHDLSLMRNFASRVAILYLGQICEIGETDILFSAPAHPYTRSLLASVPVITAEEEAMRPNVPIIEGEVPNPANLPSGCAFHTRCPEVFAPCDRIDPAFSTIAMDHRARCHLLRSAPAEANLPH